MTVKIFIKRSVMQEHEIELSILLKKMRSLTLLQPGYISGQTLRRIDRDDECIVISTWKTIEDWKRWSQSEQRMTVQNEIDMLLGEDTDYSIFSE